MKNILQDVTPPSKRSIRDIPVSRKNLKVSEKENNLNGFPGSVDGIRKINNGSSKTKWWILIILFIVALFFVLSTFMAGATIKISPKQEIIDLDSSFFAVRGDVKTNQEGIPYEVIDIESEGFRNATDATEKEVVKKASGEIIIFNDYSSQPQKLVINTRFESPDGLIYRIPKSITVPGKTTKSGKSIPGSITITVNADAPGESYNIGLVDFTVPGFKGTDRFDKFYARSKTSMTGGFSGTMKIIPDSEASQMRSDIHNDLKKELTEKIYSQLPKGFVLYKDGIFVNFESKPNVDLGDSVQVIEKGIAQAIIFDKSQISNYIAKKEISDLGDGTADILNLEDLEFLISDKDGSNLFEDVGFEFTLKGSAKLAWTFDENKMKNDFAGKAKKDTNSILANYTGVDEAEVSISPFWKMSFPSNSNKIKIERILTQ